MNTNSKKLWYTILLLAAAGVVILTPVLYLYAANLKKQVLHSKLADMGWYASDANKLGKQIKGFLEKAQSKRLDDVIALILPHAGYAYSGQTAAYGIKAINRKYKRVVVIGPSHRIGMRGILSVPRVTHYQTPLGEVALDTEFIEELLKHPQFQNLPAAHEYEHSVQSELPLLQYTQSDFKFVPIVCGQLSYEQVREVGAILKGLIDEETLVVASSDFVHYGRRFGFVPFTDNIAENLKKLDYGAYELISAIDANGFFEYRRKTGATICGYIPISILLSMLEDTTKVHLLNYTTSGQLTGDFSNSVSYFSIAFTGTRAKQPRNRPEPAAAELTDEDKDKLLTLARKTILYYLENKKVPKASDLGITPTASMSRMRAAFVTLKKDSRLRGCIGDILPRRALYKSVISNAINAAVKDWRFAPVRKEECERITIEISALTRPTAVASANEIRIGIDGVILRKSGHSAVFLPQVAGEQGWNLEQMLAHLSVKAGLDADAWKVGAEFLVFQAEVFSEKER